MYTQADISALDDKGYRDAYVDAHVKSSVAYQIRAIRESRSLTQADFAKIVGKPQSVISRLENTEYGKVTVQTLLELASAIDIALIVRFTEFTEFLYTYQDLSLDRLNAKSYDDTRASMSDSFCDNTPASSSHEPSNHLSMVMGESLPVPTAQVPLNGGQCIVGVLVTPFMAVQTSNPQRGSANG